MRKLGISENTFLNSLVFITNFYSTVYQNVKTYSYSVNRCHHICNRCNRKNKLVHLVKDKKWKARKKVSEKDSIKNNKTEIFTKHLNRHSPKYNFAISLQN